MHADTSNNINSWLFDRNAFLHLAYQQTDFRHGLQAVASEKLVSFSTGKTASPRSLTKFLLTTLCIARAFESYLELPLRSCNDLGGGALKAFTRVTLPLLGLAEV